MSVGWPQDSYLTLLMDNVRASRYPSHTMLDRVERVIADRQDAEAYLEMLLEQCSVQHPSLRMLDRIHRIVALMTFADRLEARSRESASDSS